MTKMSLRYSGCRNLLYLQCVILRARGFLNGGSKGTNVWEYSSSILFGDV